MSVYGGIVRAKHVELEGDVVLAEGTAVEIRPRGLVQYQHAQAQLAAKTRLRAVGVLAATGALDGS
jgi:hypothetical protein